MKTTPSVATIAKGIGLGAGLGYFLDPRTGATRRARFRDRAVHQRAKAGRFLDGVRADLEERSHGLVPRLRHLVRLDARDRVEDRVLVERVRAKLGKHVTHPGSIRVEAASGRITLSGPIFAAEAREAVRVARSVPGVLAVDNHLEAHPDAAGVPGLQGRSQRSHEKPEVLRDYWSPALRLFACGLGGGMLLLGMRRGAASDIPFMIGGAALFLRGWVNRPLSGRRGQVGESH
jgi:hypothetical protein